ncbi:glutamate--tRNA ligase [Spiroplasma endosymbiont of Labia minor]|uniref:glutamate--tRNA ligase n=1 Tax=Spiroplasma endosymbiont of Labia minor TaxID=3066305 RepID=UPI0030D60678
MNKNFRLRYAPSPTGYLHIGNARTALMNYLFAHHYEGSFIIRIEDTDLERNVKGAIDSQFNNLKWLGIIPDESIFNETPKEYGEYIQSKKFNHYLEIAKILVNDKKAFYCFCTQAELEIEKNRQVNNGIIATKYSGKCKLLSQEQIDKNLKNNLPYSIRFLVDSDKTYKINDLVRKDVEFSSNEIGDFVIIKTNGIATYNFAVVIDDHDMQITHVVRGEEHMSNTPRQLMIFEALNWNIPIFCHLTLIVDSNKKKLSKRSDNSLFFIEQYKEQGYIPEAVFNYISLLGWSPKNEQEIFSEEEFIRIFDERQFSRSPSTFDMNKMKWFNSVYMKKMSSDDYLFFIKEFIDSNRFKISNKNNEWLDDVLLLFKNEIEFGLQINDHLDLFFNERDYTDKLKSELLKLNDYKKLIEIFKIKLNELTEFTEDKLKTIIKETGQLTNTKGKELFMPIRIATTLMTHGPEIAKTILLIGKEKIIANIEKVI